MYISGNFLTLSALWSATQLCFATDTVSFPRQKGVKYINNQFIIEYKNTLEGNNAKETIINNPDKSVVLVNEISSRNIQVVTFPSRESAQKWLRGAKKGVKYINEDSWVFIDPQSATVNKTRGIAEEIPYGITYVNALDVSDDNAGDRKVCIVDTGYDMGHPDLPSDLSLITGETFVDENWMQDGNGHGTHVAGTIAALQNGAGVVGVIRNGQSKMHISQVFGASGSGSLSNVIAGYQSCVDNGSDVINMSLGGGNPSDSFQDAINDAWDSNILTFASSGNSPVNQYSFPASYDHIISVASITDERVISSFSTHNDKVDICAPGTNILSTWPRNNYGSDPYNTISGTSMACPHAAGVAALVWSHYPHMTNEQLQNVLEATASDLGSPGYDIYYGHGLIDAKAALVEATRITTPTVSPRPSTTPSTSAPTPTSAPTLPGLALEIALLTDDYGEETSWKVTDPNGSVVTSNGANVESAVAYAANSQYNFIYRLLPQCDYYTFTIMDGYGDGICCSYGEGAYLVTYGGVEVLSGGNFGSVQSATFGCDTTASTSPSTLATTTPSNSVLPSTSPSALATASPSALATAETCLNLEIILRTDNFGFETKWEVKGPDGIIVKESATDDNNIEYSYKYCLAPKCDYTFTIYDSYGDGMCCDYGEGGYVVTYGGIPVTSGGDFTDEESVNFGCIASCATSCGGSTSNLAISDGVVVWSDYCSSL